jgi:putative ABC transport system permease protein
MTLTGGVIGVLVAYGLAYGIGVFFAISPAINSTIITIALGLSTITGLAFGLFPAIKASHKDPIEALRQYQ